MGRKWGEHEEEWRVTVGYGLDSLLLIQQLKPPLAVSCDRPFPAVVLGALSWCSRQPVPAKPLFAGSIPARASSAMPFRLFLPIRLALLLLLVLPGPLHAQATAGRNRWPQRGWVFLSLGQGSIKSSFAGAYGGTYSPGPLVFTLRNSGAAQFFGDGIEETAFLMGVRSAGARGFVSAQLGPSAIHRYHTCDCSGNDWTAPTHGGLAFDVAVQGNWTIPGIGFDVFGDLFPSSHRYAGMAVTLQLGWFGE